MPGGCIPVVKGLVNRTEEKVKTCNIKSPEYDSSRADTSSTTLTFTQTFRLK